ncbi:MAG TPA: lysophospholipid acyltransferase family protein [Mycobacteriales bacterium]|nr:lysophospholipid acyltransferase family protein [Mycobacteriales bacterium]
MGLAGDVRQVSRGWHWTHRPLVPRSAEAHQPDRARREFPTGWARSRTMTAVRDGVHRFGLGPLLQAEIRTHVRGLDVLDHLEPPVIFIANHSSHLDTPLLLLSLPDAWRRRTAVAAAADYFFDTWWRAVGSAVVFNTFPIERRSGSLAATPGRVLDDGWNVVVFPEGTRSPDGWVGTLRPGAAYLAAAHRVPVVPVALRGSFAAMPRGRGWPLPGRPPVRVRFGPPLWVGDGEPARDFARRMSASLAQLLDEDASTWWDAARRAADGTTPAASGPPVAKWRRTWESSTPPAIPVRRGAWKG